MPSAQLLHVHSAALWNVSHADQAFVSTATREPPAHFFTVDVEEYFHVTAFERHVRPETWSSYPRRLRHATEILLDRLARANATGTFFVLGWVARHEPEVVLDIVKAGHEIASHGFWHRRVNTLTPAAFGEDIQSSKAILEDVTGIEVLGYRAPSFSIVPGCEWAFDVLLESGFRYDSSLFPIRRKAYGYPSAARTPHVIRRAVGELAEFPLATTLLAGVALPAAGGGYLRQLPFGLIRRAFREADAAGVPTTFYIHPWEIDPDQPRLPLGALTRLRHYRGLRGVLARIDRLLAEFRFTSIASALPLDASLAPRATT
jgi:polysaccharide deacetylase family protein (PEP-CTERM system associated)